MLTSDNARRAAGVHDLVTADGPDWSDKPVTVTLTGAEWTAILARAARVELSPDGARVYRVAADKLGKQLLADSAATRPLVSDLHLEARR